MSFATMSSFLQAPRGTPSGSVDYLPRQSAWKGVGPGGCLLQTRRHRPVMATWDPDGILPASAGGHFARRERERGLQTGTSAAPATEQLSQFQNEAASLLQAALGQTRPVCPISDQWAQRGGIPAADAEAYDKAAFQEQMEASFMPVDLDFPGLRIQHLDPPVFTVDKFFTLEQCQELIDAALATGEMQASKIGAGNATAVTAHNTYHSRRTSTSLVVEHGPVFRSRHPRLAAMADALQRAGLRLFGAGEGREWGTPGKLPVPQQYAYEGLQVTRYEQGQHFLAHEDGFPTVMARQNQFQRHATLLVAQLYLNDVEDGGATCFDQLNLSVQPQRGTALLFFPSFADGTPDARTLHTADGAIDTKWVTQQWVARGLAPVAVMSGAAAAAAAGPSRAATEEDRLQLLKRKKAGKGKKAAAPSKGFGRQ